MNRFRLRQTVLPHPGIIPGARGHKKVVIPAGTPAWFIDYGSKMFWCCYLDKDQAAKVKQELEDTVAGRTRRPLDLQTLVSWNFKDRYPTKVARPPTGTPK